MDYSESINKMWEELAEELGGNEETIRTNLIPSDNPATPEQIAEVVAGFDL